MASKPKPQMFCQWCDPNKVDTVYHGTYHGNVLHVGKKHPEHSEDLKKNKELYLKMFACDGAGDPLAAATPEPESTPADPPEEIPDPEKAKKTPAPEVTPPITPEKKEKPAEGGLFPNLRKLIRDF